MELCFLHYKPLYLFPRTQESIKTSKVLTSHFSSKQGQILHCVLQSGYVWFYSNCHIIITTWSKPLKSKRNLNTTLELYYNWFVYSQLLLFESITISAPAPHGNIAAKNLPIFLHLDIIFSHWMTSTLLVCFLILASFYLFEFLVQGPLRFREDVTSFLS